MADISPAWIALVGTVFGGVGLKFVESWLNRSAKKSDENKQFRDEYRLQIEDLQEEQAKLLARLAAAEVELNNWKGKYWELREDHASRTAELKTAVATIQELTKVIESRQ